MIARFRLNTLAMTLIGVSVATAGCSAAAPRPAPEELVMPAPIPNAKGRYVCPYRQSGRLADWVDLGAAQAAAWAHIRATSNLSFETADELAVYLYARHAADPDYDLAVAAAARIYPELAERYDRALRTAKRIE